MISDIKSGKLVVKDVFKKWYKIPEYQRHYLWKKEEIIALLDDIVLAKSSDSEAEYFLGTIIFQRKVIKYNRNSKYIECELLDGQQRLITLLLIIAVIRNFSKGKLKEKCKKIIYQEEDEFDDDIPERMRIVFDIRREVNDFMEDFIKDENRLNSISLIKTYDKYKKNISVKNMISAISLIQEYIRRENIDIIDFFKYLNNKVLMVYVSSSNLEDSIQLFNVINDRGMRLRYIDTLKAVNLRAVPTSRTKDYATVWEDIENYFGSEKDFELFLSHLRMILMKDKALNSRNLFDDFEKIYSMGLLQKGKDTFRYIERYKNYYDFVLNFNHSKNNYQIDNLINLIKLIPSEFWIAPLLKFIDKFKGRNIPEFLEKLDNVISYEWIISLDAKKRKERIINIIKAIDKTSENNIANLLNHQPVLKINCKEFIVALNKDMNMVNKRVVKYLLHKLEYIHGDNGSRIYIANNGTVEHILPKKPDENSQWLKDFTPKERADRINKLGNLILLSKINNSQLENLDFDKKKNIYLNSNIEPFRHSIKVMNSYSKWTPEDIDTNQQDVVMAKLCKHYCGESGCNMKIFKSSYLKS